MSPKKETGFSAEEKAAMKERVKELKAAERADSDRSAGGGCLVIKGWQLLIALF